MYSQPVESREEFAEQKEQKGPTKMAVEGNSGHEDALIAAIFEQIQLPQVRFAQSPTIASPPAGSTPAPPNSVRSEAATETPLTPTPRAAVAEEEEGIAMDRLKLGPEVEEEPPLHLLAHRNSLERGHQSQPEAEHVQTLNLMDEEETVEGGEEESTPREQTLGTPSTGECCLDTGRSLADATYGGSPQQGEEEEVREREDDRGVSRVEEEEANDASRGSSEMSRELVETAIESALQNCSETGRPEETRQTQTTLPREEEEEEEHMNDEPLLERTAQFQLELNQRIVGNRLSQSLSPASGQSSPGGSSGPASRDIHVRTSLNDPSSPLVAKAYSAFEPDKQELIRREIGSTGPERIRRMVGRFQSIGGIGQPGEEEDEEKDDEDGKKRAPALHVRQKSAHFQLDKVQMEEECQEQPKRKNTPHPWHHEGSSSAAAVVVEESQRPVAEILSQFQRSQYSHANGKSSALANGGALHRQGSLNSDGGGYQGIPNKHNGSASIWANGRAKMAGDPAPGSVAAIRKSLGSSVPSTPTSPGMPMLTNGGVEALRSGQTSPLMHHGKGGVLPKNVGHFYRLWGSAQAQSATANGQAMKAPSPVGNGGPSSMAATQL